MEAFKSLTVGLRFDKARHRDEMQRFQKEKKSEVDGVAVKEAEAALAPSQSVTASQLKAPPPCGSLDLFGTRSEEGDAGSGEAGAESGAQGSSEKVHKPLAEMSKKRMAHIWAKNSLKVGGADVPPPIEHFSNLVRPPLNVPDHIVNNLFTREHRVPTPIQMQAIPALIHKRDVIACAPTGSGKTLAFLIPMFATLREPNPATGVRALIISPTMELAVQIEREVFFLMKGKRWKLVQHGQSTKGKDIFVTTPGRVATMIKEKLIDLSHVEYLVFDEGDKLWDDKTDFLPVIDAVISACSNPNKVVALFTATLSEKIESSAKSVMTTDPIRIIVRGRTSASKDVEQKLVFCTNELGKVIAVRNFIREGLKPPVLIFVQSIERTKELFDEIRCAGLHVALIHSRMTSDERDEVVLNFRLGKVWVLITTELLARGMDFKNIGTVINFDMPLTPESYVHRVGRTGRAGKKGVSVTLFTTDDYERLPAIAKLIHDAGYPVEDWMLEMKVSRKRQRELERITPHRMIVSTQKRITVGLQRTERQIRAAERERAAKQSKKKRLAEANGDDDDVSEADDDVDE